MSIGQILFDSKSRFLSSGWIFVVGLFCSGCVTVIQPPVFPDEQEEIISTESAQQSWAEVLSQSVDPKGRVNFRKVSEDPVSLHRMILYVSQTSPKNKPDWFMSTEERMAYYLNSYNALAMYGVISCDFPSDFNGFTDRAKFFAFTDFTVGGEEISLYDYENEVIRPLGDPRVHFALNCMVKACPRLPQTPFRAADLENTLNALAREFLNDARHVQVVESERKVRLSEILSFYEEDFVNPKEAASLIEYINRYRTSPIDKNFSVEFIPYDWTVNYQ